MEGTRNKEKTGKKQGNKTNIKKTRDRKNDMSQNSSPRYSGYVRHILKRFMFLFLNLPSLS